MMSELYKVLKNHMISNYWDDINVKEQARAIFTTICIVGDLEADMNLTDNMLLELYNSSALEELGITYQEFETFMIKDIV